MSNTRVIDSPYTPSPSFLANYIVNNDKLSTSGVDNPIAPSNTNTMAKTDISTCTDLIPTYKYLTNSIVNSAVLSTGGVDNQAVSPNKNTMVTSTNEMDVSKDMASDNRYILINASVK